MTRALENKNRELAVLGREVIKDVSMTTFKVKLEKLGASHAECGRGGL